MCRVHRIAQLQTLLEHLQRLFDAVCLKPVYKVTQQLDTATIVIIHENYHFQFVVLLSAICYGPEALLQSVAWDTFLSYVKQRVRTDVEVTVNYEVDVTDSNDWRQYTTL